MRRPVTTVQVKTQDQTCNPVFALVTDNTTASRGHFSIDATTGVIWANDLLDYEEFGPTSFDLVVQVRDAMKPTLAAVCRRQILLTDVNDHGPVFVYPRAPQYYRSVLHRDRAVSGRQVAHVRATDDDNSTANAGISYSLIMRSSAKPYRINATTGSIVVAEGVDSATLLSSVIWAIATDSATDHTLRKTGEALVLVGIISDADLNRATVAITSDHQLYEAADALNSQPLSPGDTVDTRFVALATAFESKMSQIICPTRGCVVAVYNISGESGGSGSGTTAASRVRRGGSTAHLNVLYYVWSSNLDGGKATFNAMAPSVVSAVVESPTAQVQLKEIIGLNVTFQSVQSNAPTTRNAQPTATPTPTPPTPGVDSGLSTTYIIILCVGSIVLCLGIALLIFFCVLSR